MDTENIRGFIASLDSSIDELKEVLEPVLSTSLEDKIAQCKLPQMQIKIYNSHLYCVISILYCYIKVLGINTDDHPIMKELARIKQVMKSVKDVEESLKKKDDQKTKSQEDARDFLQRTLGTNFGAAVPDSMKSPAISSANFQGTHTKFKDLEDNREKISKATTTKHKPSGKVTKPKKVTKN